MYQLIEAPDITLGCLTKPGVQNWVLGLVRAQSFLPSPKWQQIGGSEAGNPTVIPAVKEGCYIQYHRLFTGGATTFLEYFADGWMQIFRLVPGSGTFPIVAGPPPSR